MDFLQYRLITHGGIFYERIRLSNRWAHRRKNKLFFFVVFYSSVLCLIYFTVRSNNIGMKIAHTPY